ncbi:hypothetical protein K5549_011331 [Capra hircus]|uniref:Uncharacterized protein n=1 Tax=Capra hircus TaxID=9925 RepID=A0A452FW44_CAPHI|nr:hypothetical protein K5549_011331 [Capra hircus]
MWCAPKLDAPQATPRRPLRVSGTIQSRARRPPAPPPPPPGEPSSAPHRSILWYMAGRPPRGRRRGRQSLGRGEGRGRWGAGSSGWAAGPAASPRQGTHPLPPSDSLLGVLESTVPCTPKIPKHTDRGLSGKAVPGNSKRGAGGCSQISRAPGSREILPKSFGRVRAGGWGAGKRFKAPPGGSSLLHDSHPPRIH